MILTGKVGALYTSDTSTAFNNEAMTDLGGGLYQITDTAKRVWDANVAPTYSGSSLPLDETYGHKGINYLEGIIKLTAAGETITTDGAYLSLQKVAETINWTATGTSDALETTSIGDSVRTYIQGLDGSTVSISRYRTDTVFDGNALYWILKLYETGDVGAGSGYMMLALKTSLGWTKSVGAIDSESLSFQVSGPWTAFTEV